MPKAEYKTLKPLISHLPRPVYGHIDSQPNMIIPRRHRHNWAQLSYTIRGYLQIHTNTANFIALPQRAVWIPAGIEHQVLQHSVHTIIRSLYIDKKYLKDEWQNCRVLAVSPLLHELVRRFSTLPVLYDVQGPDGRLVQVLLDQLAISKEAGLVLPWPSDPRLQPICKELQNSPDSALNLSNYSKKIGVSDKTLTRLFQQETGLGFRLWRQRARLVHALPLLESGQRITDVALACGYESLSAFIATFKQHTGVTPGEFAAYKEDDPSLYDRHN